MCEHKAASRAPLSCTQSECMNALMECCVLTSWLVSARVYSVCEPFGYQPCFVGATDPCCDAYGKWLTTGFGCELTTPGSSQTMLGYCKAGRCASHACNHERDGLSLRVFCGASKVNPCKASCSAVAKSKCYDTATFRDGGERLDDGSVCMKDLRLGKGKLLSDRSLFANWFADIART